jgi:hypothetical protein
LDGAVEIGDASLDDLVMLGEAMLSAVDVCLLAN